MPEPKKALKLEDDFDANQEELTEPVPTDEATPFDHSDPKVGQYYALGATNSTTQTHRLEIDPDNGKITKVESI